MCTLLGLVADICIARAGIGETAPNYGGTATGEGAALAHPDDDDEESMDEEVLYSI